MSFVESLTLEAASPLQTMPELGTFLIIPDRNMGPKDLETGYHMPVMSYAISNKGPEQFSDIILFLVH